MNLEDKVRVTVHDLADGARFPDDLAAGARQRGRRIRRRRQAGVAAAAVALVASASIPYALLHRDEPAPQPQPQPAATTSRPIDWGKSPLTLPGKVIVTAVSRIDPRLADVPSADGSVVLDRRTGRYVQLPDDYHRVWGAPKVNRAVVSGDRHLGIIAANGEITWTDVTPGPDPQWSPDGTRVLATSGDGFAIIDAASGAVSRHATFDETYACPDECRFTWLPDGKRVAIPVRDITADRSEAKLDMAVKVAIHDASTGKRLETIPVPGAPADQDAWSPDGRRVVLKHTSESGWANRVIFDVETQQILADLGEQDAHFLPDGRLLGFDRPGARVRLYDVRGRVLEEMSLPRSFANRTVSIGMP
ncbi:hypothetical protein [Paractinoplanes lichenicola]|uniref:Protein TolB n=1 Tax=Paractinoplanes lichenicola TaxID=2802976 RepID=A0ABS1W3U4_9ACTN|nr:hypothetical protein [Actinoplanes lichenicola]MBL7261409.1 hypothetical protein [Actinoplanes lichenicola]